MYTEQEKKARNTIKNIARGNIIKMTLEQEAFRKYHEDKQRDTFTVSFNKDERALLEVCKQILEQKKDSTALKQLAFIGAEVIQEKKIAKILALLFKNKRNNERIGVADFE